MKGKDYRALLENTIISKQKKKGTDKQNGRNQNRCW